MNLSVSDEDKVFFSNSSNCSQIRSLRGRHSWLLQPPARPDQTFTEPLQLPEENRPEQTLPDPGMETRTEFCPYKEMINRERMDIGAGVQMGFWGGGSGWRRGV